jgi:hypothetical protein
VPIFIKGFQHLNINKSQSVEFQLVVNYFYFLKSFDNERHNSTFDVQKITHYEIWNN